MDAMKAGGFLKEEALLQMTQLEAREFLEGGKLDPHTVSKSTALAIALIAYRGMSKHVLEAIINRKYPVVQRSQYDRNYPEMGMEKSISTGTVSQPLFFEDSEIIQIHPQSLHKKKDGVSVFKTDHDGRVVIQQQTFKGCTAAATAMLCFSKGEDLDLSYLKDRGLGDDQDMVEDIQLAGLEPKVSFFQDPENRQANLEEIRQYIEKNGPAIVDVDPKILGGHEVVVDSVNESSVELRDPYHGWAISVQKEAFEKIISGDRIVQLEHV